MALDGLLARVQQSLHAQREFAGNVAHELRTPLAGIRAQAAHALAHNDPAVWRSEIEGIAQAEQRASRTVDQLLALARAAEGGIALTLQPLALQPGLWCSQVFRKHGFLTLHVPSHEETMPWALG